jgi:hypothetical protein
MRALRNDRVTLVEKGSPLSLCVMESGKLLPGVKVVIANPETRGLCADSHLGEVSATLNIIIILSSFTPSYFPYFPNHGIFHLIKFLCNI